MPTSLTLRLFAQAAEYPVADAAIIATALYFVLIHQKQLLHYPGQLLTAAISMALAALAYTSMSHLSTTFTGLQVLALGCLPILATHPDGHILFQAANLLGIYRALCNWSEISELQAVQSVGHLALMLSTMNNQKQQLFGSIWETITFSQIRKLLRLQHSKELSLDDIPQQPYWFSANNTPFNLDTTKKYHLIRAIVQSGWKSLLPLYLVKLLLDMLKIVQIYMNSRMLLTFDSDSISTRHVFYAIISWYLLSAVTDRAREVDLYIEKMWEQVENNAFTGILDYVQNNNKNKIYISQWDVSGHLEDLLEAIQGIVSTIYSIFDALIHIIPLFLQVRYLIIVPFAVDIGIKLVLHVLQAATYKYLHVDDGEHTYSYDVCDIFTHIRSIKMFAWEPVYLNSEKHVTFNSKYSLSYACKNCIHTVINTIHLISKKLSAYIIVYMHLSQKSNITTSTSSFTADIYQLSTLSIDAYKKTTQLFRKLKDIKNINELSSYLENVIAGKTMYILSQVPDIQTDASPSVVINECSFTQHDDSEDAFLENISLNAKAGEIVAVAGKSGSGKSTLLLSICGEKKLVQGTGQVTGRVAYLEQPPFIIDDTIRANILFGRPMDVELYKQVIYACAFHKDIGQWPDADLTLIGQNGINISGGQRARLALARALYVQADIYVLDDPLSAVDAHVKHHLMEHVLLDTGMLKGKLRIISANTEHILPFANQIITLDNGCAVVEKQIPQSYKAVLPAAQPQVVKIADSSVNNRKLATSHAVLSSDVVEKTKNKTDQPIERSVWSNLMYLVHICGWPAIIAVVLTGLIKPVMQFIIDGYILASFKTQGYQNNLTATGLGTFFYMTVVSRIVNDAVSTILRDVDERVTGRLLKNKIANVFKKGVIHAPLSYFDNTTEYILKDAYKNSSSDLARICKIFITQKPAALVGILLSLYRVAGDSPYMLLIALPAAILQQQTTNMISTLTKIILAISKLSAYNANTLRDIISFGESTIRIFGVGTYFYGAAEDALQIEGIAEMFSDQLDYFANMIMYSIENSAYIVHFSACHLHSQTTGVRINSGEYIHYSSTLSTLGKHLRHLFSIPGDVYKLSGKIDILRHYADITSEAPYTIKEYQPAEDWPQHGKIEIANLSMKYQDDLGNALNNINLTIEPGEKIGIVGRTGAGKSSLAKALFRLIPGGISGSIKIDGLETTDMGVGDLRSSLGIIPQEASIFDGSVRDNLDPFNRSSVEDIWATLIRCNAAEVVAPPKNTKMARHKRISDKEKEWQAAGIWKKLLLIAMDRAPSMSNTSKSATRPPLDQPAQSAEYKLSSGQEQLFSLCRLVLCSNKVIVLDEATANVDLETDNSIQQVVQKEFADCTVLTIAHRLETIMNSDRIIVMDQGEIKEIGAPQDLLETGGYFAELVEANDFGQYVTPAKAA